MSRAFVSYSTMERAWIAVDAAGRSAGSFDDEAAARSAVGLPSRAERHDDEDVAVFYYSDGAGWWRQRGGEPPCGPFDSFAACVGLSP